MLKNGKALVKSSTEPLFAVEVDSTIPREKLIPEVMVILHQRNFAILDVISKEEYPDIDIIK
jgi:ATP-dependent 26S proteasome regulatory subunit